MLFVFLFITLVLVIKLNDILGVEIEPREKKNKSLNKAKKEESSAEEIVLEKQSFSIDRKLYPNFSPEDFLKKAEKAFEMVFKAYAEKDLETLKELLTPRMFKAFSQAISERDERKETLEGTLIRFISSKIINTSKAADTLIITVEFLTEQCNVLKSEIGEILEGNPNYIERRKDICSFSRPKNSNTKKWFLSGIDSE